MIMKKTQWIELVRSIRGSLISFISIVMFVALGIAIFGGLTWTGSNAETAVNRAYREDGFHSFQVTYPFGLSTEQIAQFRDVDGVEDAEGYNTVYQYYCRDGEQLTAVVMQMTARLNRCTCIEGTLPERAGEAAVLAHWAKANGVSVGDTITLEPGDDETLRLLRAAADYAEKGEGELPTGNALTTDTFTVTALVESPMFINTNPVTYGVVPTTGFDVSAPIFVTADAFDPDVMAGYNTVAISSDTLSGLNSYSDEYLQGSKTVAERITALTDTWNSAVVSDFHTAVQNAKEELDGADGDIQKAKGEIADGEKTLADGKKDYEKGKAQLARGEKELTAAKALLAEKEREYQAGKKSYEENLALHQDAQADFDCVADLVNAAKAFVTAVKERSGEADADVLKEIARQTGLTEAAAAVYDRFQGRQDEVAAVLKDATGISVEDLKNLNYTDVFSLPANYEKVAQILSDGISGIISYYQQAEEKLAQAGTRLNDEKAKLALAELQMQEAKKQIQSGEQKLAKSRAELVAAEKTVADGEKQLEESKEKLEQVLADYDAGTRLYEQIRDDADKVDSVKAMVMERKNNIAFATTKQLLDIVQTFRYSLALVFFVVSLMVCYSSVSRMVDNSVRRIGTQKALGFYDGEILRHYLLYVAFAVILGGILGALLGVFVVEDVFTASLYRNYTVQRPALTFSAAQVLLPFGTELVLIVLVAYTACAKSLKRNATELLAGGVQTVGKRRFYEKLRLWKRLPLLSKTIINNLFTDKKRVFGMLLGITGCTTLLVMGLTFYMNYSDSLQRQFDTYFLFDGVVSFRTEDPDASAEIRTVLDKYDVPYAEVIHTRMIRNDPSGLVAIPYVTVPADKAALAELVHFRTDPAGEEAFTDGVWIGNFHKYSYGTPTVELTTFTGTKAQPKIARYFNNHLLTSHIFMDMDTYRSNFDGNAVPNAYYFRTDGVDRDALLQDLRAVDGYRFFRDYRSGASMAFLSIGSVTQVIAITYVVLAIAMAFMVLMNLLAVYVEEKKRELITLVINGYPRRFARRYIYQDTLILTVLGILLGVAAGSVLGINALHSMEGENFRLIHSVNWSACAVGALITAAVTLIITGITMHRVNRLKLTDINT